MAGYSGTPLPKRLGIKAGNTVCLLNAPGAFERAFERGLDHGDAVRVSHSMRVPFAGCPVDVVVLFVDRLADLERRFSNIAARLHPAGGFWVVWPKHAARPSTDISDDIVRRVALAGGMVDNKECALGGAWSGLRLVLRGANRDAVAYRAEPAVPLLSRRTRRPTAAAKVAHRTSATTGGAGSTLRRVRARSTR
jgi:hypothetical protein